MVTSWRADVQVFPCFLIFDNVVCLAPPASLLEWRAGGSKAALFHNAP